MIETNTIIEALHYILKGLGKADKIKLVKLMYLADKYHLIRYGRTISNDDYYAMEHGPVGTTVKDVLSLDSFNISSKGYKYASKLLRKIDENIFEANPDANISFDMLSETDREALDFVINEFGKMRQWQLRDYTHKYPEWYQYKALFQNRRTKRERIETKELLSIIPNDRLGMSKKHIEESRKILTGDFD
jgi:uncharacterized phage-associated protein